MTEKYFLYIFSSTKFSGQGLIIGEFLFIPTTIYKEMLLLSGLIIQASVKLCYGSGPDLKYEWSSFIFLWFLSATIGLGVSSPPENIQ